MEALARDAVTRQLNVQSMLQDLGIRNSEENDRRQSAFMEEVRRQVREAADLHIGAALADFTNKFETVIAQVKEAIKPADMPQQAEPAIEQEPAIAQEPAIEQESAKMNNHLSHPIYKFLPSQGEHVELARPSLRFGRPTS